MENNGINLKDQFKPSPDAKPWEVIGIMLGEKPLYRLREVGAKGSGVLVSADNLGDGRWERVTE